MSTGSSGTQGHAPNVMVQHAPTMMEEVAYLLRRLQGERPRLTKGNDALDQRVGAMLDKLDRMGVQRIHQ